MDDAKRYDTPVISRLLVACLVLLGVGFDQANGKEPGDTRAEFRNPYYERATWRVWRDDDTPVPGVVSLVREGKAKKQVSVTLRLPKRAERIYPTKLPEAAKGPALVFKARTKAPKQFAGMWDDVYSSWSGLHGYVRTRWRGADGSVVPVRGHIVDFVDVKQETMLRAGVNFVHQSTTGMGHAISNGVMPDRTASFEKLYFGNVLVTAPAHASLTDYRPDYSTDLYTAHIPTLLHSVGSSNSETMAITKLAIVGAYLPPDTKRLLKRNGLYAAALLYLWKAALPYDVPYAHELRHRIAYKAVGDRHLYAKLEKYGAAGIDRGDLSLPYHCYDDGAHMRRMAALAASMDVAPPEALLSVIRADGAATGSYSLRKSVLVVQEPGTDVTLRLSTAGCYDLQGLPLTTRFALLYGNPATTVVPHPDEPDEWSVHVPWDDTLPEGRTTVALVANNGRFDSNPAHVTVYRKRADELPPSGLGPKDYRWPGTHANRRPILLGLQDTYVRPGKRCTVPLHAVDPEGRVVAFYKRRGDVGAIEGNTFTWTCPKKAPKEPHVVTVIASDQTGGSSYGGEALTIHVGKPRVLAQIDIDVLTGPAPVTVTVSGKPSIGRRLKYAWDFYAPSHKRKAKALDQWTGGRETTHTFQKPGVYDVALTVTNSSGTDTEVVRILVTEGEPSKAPAALRVLHAGVWIRPDDDDPCAFDGTDFGVCPVGERITRVFRLANPGDEPLALTGPRIALTGEGAEHFRITARPSGRIGARGATQSTIAYAPRAPGAHVAQVLVRAPTPYRFSLRGASR